MNFQSYLNQFTQILENPNPPAPYDDPAYAEYVKLNWSRLSRWTKGGEIIPELKEVVSKINKPMNWVIITEPWCGDAAHIVPFIHLIASLNPLIHAEYELRDSEPFTINQYLTNGGKAIPIVVVRDENGKDIFRWGPRPKLAQDFFLELKNKGVEMDEVKTQLQLWYNKDKGQALQNEFVHLLSNINQTTGNK
ncbi:MAG: thioredoxin family protein [Bacteroidetes bacterium]|nr:thioredoxin family protein [Bacteroidota bacterium]